MNNAIFWQGGFSLKEYDVIVVGGGPGGATTAALLGKQGRNVLLVDKAKFPRDKTCGDAISGKSATMLRELGLIEAVEQHPHEDIWGVTFSSPEGVVVDIDFPRSKEGKPQGYVCRRFLYDNLLFQHAKNVLENAGNHSETWERFQVMDVLQENGFVVGIKGLHMDTKNEEEAMAKVVVGADGATSAVATKLGLNHMDPKHHCGALRAYYKGISGLTKNIEIHFVEALLPGYFWIFPLENGYANVGVGMLTSDIQAKKVNLKQAMFDAIEKIPMFQKRFEGAELVGDVRGWNLPFGSTHRKNYGNGFLLVGDAASLIDPFSGEGIGNAMTAGGFAAKAIQTAFQKNDFSEATLQSYDRELWNEISGELKNSYRLQKLGKHRFLLNWMIRKAARSQQFRETLSAMLANREGTKQFADPLFYLKILFM